MGLFSRKKPKIKMQSTKNDNFSGWLKCTHCGEMIHTQELEKNLNCCTKCNYHYRLPATSRIQSIADTNTFKELFSHLESTDSLKFKDTEKYSDRLNRSRKKTGRNEAFMGGICEIGGKPTALGVMDFSFMGGSMGSVVGERITRLVETALDKQIPLVIVATSGGARMQESTLSLMQMAKTSSALARLHDAKIPYISILTNPTTGGVTASFATLADIIIAEPDALIAFAGPRVVEQTIGQPLPPGAQKSEFLLEHGMVDCILPRHEIREQLIVILSLLTENERNDKNPLPKKGEDEKQSTSFKEKLQKLLNVVPSKENI